MRKGGQVTVHVPAHVIAEPSGVPRELLDVATVLALTGLGKNVEQLTDVLVRLSRVPHGDLAVDDVAVPPPRALDLDVPRRHEVGDDALNGPLGNADGDGDVAQP